jgi:nitrite reductase/ring-hydroxylating ferredoxin subunit
MRNVPLWIDTGPIKRFRQLEKDTNVDVVVVGAGVTGVTTAYLLKQAGLTVALIERERVASIDTGHTIAHLAYVTDLELQELAHILATIMLRRRSSLVRANYFDSRGQWEEKIHGLDLFAVDRKKLKGATWNYVRENKDYPYYMIKDRFARPEADSIRELNPGYGMVIGSRWKKLAAFRDQNGRVYKLSPVCPHMGCHVRWNSAESTWDCPCHGSRFKPTGEVIAGPAEKGLTPVS